MSSDTVAIIDSANKPEPEEKPQAAVAGSVSSDSENEERDESSVTGGGSSTASGVVKQRISSTRKRIIDETLLSAEEAEKLESRRAYNRECATRARKRTKTLVNQLQDEVKSLQTDKEELRRENAVLKAQLEGFEKQNQTLMFKNVMADHRAMGTNPGAFMPPTLRPGGVTLGDALTEMRMATLASREAASRAYMFPIATQNLLGARFPGGAMP
jgi:FtsZ-binding cell division protein ZapB